MREFCDSAPSLCSPLLLSLSLTHTRQDNCDGADQTVGLIMLPSTLVPTATPAVSPLPTNTSSFLDSEFRYALFPPIYGLIFATGLLANIYVLFVIRCLREARAMGEIRIYMTNLTVADLLFVVTLVLMGLNCILDPVVYYFATRKFRKFIMQHLKRFVKGEGCSNTSTSQISMDSRPQMPLQDMDKC
uniref:G-protein coupled receptors family 1 profile domain-containing protein n=1 Tax=Knipowitschia caucasica TaxID=637954 RepID=A0AAV2JFF2_KNICA